MKRKGNFKGVDAKREVLTVRFALDSNDTEETRVVAATNFFRVQIARSTIIGRSKKTRSKKTKLLFTEGE